MSRRTVDITVDAYDAPSLIAVARERERQRELGHADGAIPCFAHGYDLTPLDLEDIRERNDSGDVSCESLLTEEFEETIYELRGADFGPLWIFDNKEREEARIQHLRNGVTELHQLAALALRIASKMQCDLDAKGGV
jgi:hypothetical protein